MSVRGEFRRLGGDLLVALRDAGEGGHAADLVPLLERSSDDLSGAAEDALALLGRLGAPPADAELRRRFEAARERLDAVCRIILGRPASSGAGLPGC